MSLLRFFFGGDWLQAPLTNVRREGEEQLRVSEAELDRPKHPKPGKGKGRLRSTALQQPGTGVKGWGGADRGGEGQSWLRVEDPRGAPDRVNATHNRTAEGPGSGWKAQVASGFSFMVQKW